ncbi:tetratricopeptide repeat protein [archaeon]|jgi:tetratricopeptide (TPR) repeat protein|nr:tetratricopeptide repeat protein [Candidatus Woesearchaeota archaeon]MBT3720203.1 tetratricopeptide repeat protein [archaeon]MBT4022626.1 tetratricopeptide repeat protein [archaeon]MBT4272066.1 tetratricopeptide repeat protein [archaeon]MBT4461163.1 tetratricopeptide repeat protein [archaeon]
MKANKSNFKLDNLNLILSFLFLIGGICFIVIFYNNIFDITPTKYSCNSQYFNSNNPDEIFNISECYLNNSEINQSIDVLNNAIKHGVINLDIFLSLAGQYYEQVDFDSAKKVYEYAKKEYPNSPRLYDKIGNLHKSLGYKNSLEFEKALEAYQKAINLEPNNPQHYENLGIVYSQLNEPEKANFTFIQGKEKSSYNYSFYLGWSEYYRSIGNYKKSNEYLKKLVDSNPNIAHYKTELARNYLIEGEIELAKEYYSKAIDNGWSLPTYNCPYEGLGLIYYMEGNHEKSEEYLKKSIALNPKVSDLNRRALANLYVSQNRTNEAISTLNLLINLTYLDYEKNKIENYINQLKQGKKPHIDLGPLEKENFADIAQESNKMFFEGEKKLRDGDYEQAEKKYINSLELNQLHEYSSMRLLYLYFAIYGNKQKTLNLFEEYSATFNSDTKNTFKSLIYLDSNNILKAKKHLDLISNHSDLSYLPLGEYYLETGEYKKAYDCFERSIDLRPLDAFDYFEIYKIDRILRAIIKVKQYDLAYDFIEKINSLSDKWFYHNKAIELKILESKGYIALNNNNFTESENYFNELKEKNPVIGCSFQGLGVLYSKTQKYTESTINYINGADLTPYSSRDQFLAAYSCFLTGDYNCANKYVDKAINLNDNIEYLELKGFILIMENKPHEAKVIFDKILREKESIIAKSGLGHIALINKNYTLSKQIFEELLNQSLKNSYDNIHIDYNYMYETVPLGLAWSYSNQNQHKDALEYYDMILNKTPDHLLALISKGNALLWLERYDEAKKIFDYILKLYPNNEYALAELGLLEYNLGNLTEAQNKFNQALEQNSETYTCPYEGLGLVYYKQGNLDLAKENFEKSIEINPDIEYKKFNLLAKIYIEEGRRKDAKILLLKSIENYPYDPEAKLLLEQIS